MSVQKICIIGDGLAGLSAAIILSQEHIKIDLYTGNNLKKLKTDDRTTALSENSFQFINIGIFSYYGKLYVSSFDKGHRFQ